MSTLYIVATPIGNLNDISFRAIEILKSVDLIAAEDTRHAKKLLHKFDIHTPLISCHDHNERSSLDYFIASLKQGRSIALISDAGTPLISDPGYLLVKAAHEDHIKITPIPGACAAIAALSASGLACERFIFEGFLPAAAAARKRRLTHLKHQPCTLIFYEAPHRLEKTLFDICEAMGETRQAALARELTKTYETIYKATIKKIHEFVKNDLHQSKGECVLLVSGLSKKDNLQEKFIQARNLLENLLEYLPLKKAVKITAQVIPVSKNILYDHALSFHTQHRKNHDAKV